MISQPEPAPDHETDQQNRRSAAELEQHSTAGHVCFAREFSKYLLFVEEKVESSTRK